MRNERAVSFKKKNDASFSRCSDFCVFGESTDFLWCHNTHYCTSEVTYSITSLEYYFESKWNLCKRYIIVQLTINIFQHVFSSIVKFANLVLGTSWFW